MGQHPEVDIKSLAFKVLGKFRAIPESVPVDAPCGTANESFLEVNPYSTGASPRVESPGAPPKRFGPAHAVLFPLIGKRVWTPRGPGRLETVYAKRCEVVLDSDPEKMALFAPTQIGAAI
jgi:hypothetical protein